MTRGFDVERIDDVRLEGAVELVGKNLMSPFVWRGPDGGLTALVRAVPPGEEAHWESGRIWRGRSRDGLIFCADAAPLIAPDADGYDARGCEDPTVVATSDGVVVFYTGVDRDGTGHLLYATGPDLDQLRKRGVAMPNAKGGRNSKEATVSRDGDRWRLLYEYSVDGHSLVSLVEGNDPAGPWTELPDPFGPREGMWDGWHLSTGPLLHGNPDRPVMFYNGANKDAHWGVGWIALTPDLRSVVARGEEPLIAPPPDDGGSRDISFAASVVETDGAIWLYFSRNDRELKRATLHMTDLDREAASSGRVAASFLAAGT